MKTLAFVFSYNRPETLKACLESLYFGSKFIPTQIVVLDDGSSWETKQEILTPPMLWPSKSQYAFGPWDDNQGLSRSAVSALSMARESNPDFVFLIEGDYVFRSRGLDCVMDCLTNTPEGDSCLGIAGYDHPNQRQLEYTDHIFPDCMKAQVGEDNVNRSALHRPRMVEGLFNYSIELVSNTCFTSYLHWGNICKVAAEFPELWDLLDQACAPRENPNYPDSGKYKSQRTVDDGMLSHALSLCWNRYAIKHGLDRERLGAWLNIRPSVAEHRFEGGTNFG